MKWLGVRKTHLIIGFAILEAIYLIYICARRPDSVAFWRRVPEPLSPDRNLTEIILKFMEDIKDQHPCVPSDRLTVLHRQLRPMQQDLNDLQDNQTENPLTIELLNQYIQVPEETRKALGEMHKNVVQSIPPLLPGTVSGRGIVMTGGGHLFENALASIRYFNQHQPGIPIELWLSRAEYDPKYCEEILPKSGVTCMVFEDELGPQIQNFPFSGYPSKSLALLGSKFEEIYFTDVDSFPIYDLDDLFESEIFKDYGFISWPDYWLRVSSPTFYDVAGVFDIETIDPKLELYKVPGTVKEKMATEAGQMVFNKTRHWSTLCLSAYYNLNGQDFYYRLLSQHPHVFGFGDKETWISAAAALGNPVYQVQEGIVMMGYEQPNEAGFVSTAMVQRDPLLDYRRHVLKQGLGSFDVRPYIVHGNQMKLNPYQVFGDDPDKFSIQANMFYQRRLLGDLSQVKRFFRTDIEMRLFEALEYSICKWLVKDRPINAPADADMELLCQRAKTHTRWLKKNKSNPLEWPAGALP